MDAGWFRGEAGADAGPWVGTGTRSAMRAIWAGRTGLGAGRKLVWESVRELVWGSVWELDWELGWELVWELVWEL